jgi:hypothetical protein
MFVQGGLHPEQIKALRIAHYEVPMIRGNSHRTAEIWCGELWQ